MPVPTFPLEMHPDGADEINYGYDPVCDEKIAPKLEPAGREGGRHYKPYNGPRNEDAYEYEENRNSDLDSVNLQ